MKKKIALLLVAILLVSSVAFAEVNYVKNAYFSDAKLFLRGNQVDKPILIIDGTSYLPVRALSEAMGLDVGWDGETHTITLDDPADGDQAAIAKEFEVLDELKADLTTMTQERDALQAKLDKLMPKIDEEGDLISSKPFQYTFNEDSNWDYTSYGTDAWNYKYDAYDLYANQWNDKMMFQVGEQFYDLGLGVVLDRSTAYYLTVYNEKLEYTTFTCQFAIDSRMTKNQDYKNATFEVKSNDKVVFEQLIDVTDGIVDFSTDITGLEKITVAIRRDEEKNISGDYALILNPRLK